MNDLVGLGMTMVVVTHELQFAREAANAIVFMDDGVVVESGKPEEVLVNPKTERTRIFISRLLGSKDER